jgi:hypothetical protein
VSGPFKVGEVCIGQNFVNFPEYNGCECLIERPLQMFGGFNRRTGEWCAVEPSYFVRWADGAGSWVGRHNLRRKQPPTGEIAIMRMFDITAPAPREVEAA